MIKEIETIVEAACASERNVFGYGIWTHHITEVARNGRRLASLFEADPDIVEMAALLHDYASVKDEALYEEHHLHGPVEAEKILTRLGCPPDRIEAVKHAIAAHRASVRVEQRSAEAVCLANADALTHIEQVPSLLHLVYVQRGMGIDEGAAWVKAKLQRSWNKLSPPAQAMARDKYEAALQTLSLLETVPVPS
ncbi:MAG: HD domain-containing protein [Rhodothermales bacterium]